VVLGQFVGLALPGQASDALQATSGERVEVALHAPPGDAGEGGDGLVGTTLTLEPQDLQLLLNTRMRVMVAFVADGIEVCGREGEAAQRKLQCSGQPAALYESRPLLAIVPGSFVSSIDATGNGLQTDPKATQQP
jgi:hypothetical protein